MGDCCTGASRLLETNLLVACMSGTSMRSMACVVALFVAGAGCMGSDSDASRCGDTALDSWTAYDTTWPGDQGAPQAPETDPRQPWETVVAVRGGLQPSFVGDGGSVLVLGDGSDRLAVLSTPVPPEGFAMQWEGDDGVACPALPAYTWDLAAPAEGELVEVGSGALVRTAGFWENGTLFYTNIAQIDDGDWPRAGWYGFASGEPLQVYVYDKERDEIPPQWGDADGGLPIAAPAGSPTEYFPTIPGFNEALKGLSTTTTIVAHLSPEEAYTRPGNEQHPLYGDALVFLIHVEAAADRPCPAAAQGSASGEFCFRE